MLVLVVFSGMVGGLIVDPAKGYTGYTYPTYDDIGNKINDTVSPKGAMPLHFKQGDHVRLGRN